MKGTKGKLKRWLGFLLVLVTVPCANGVLFQATGNPAFNTNAPSGTLTNSGWQYEGLWSVYYLGTPIAPTFFLTARHIGGYGASNIVLNGVSYTTVASFDDPETDLRIWQVAQTFPYYAPLYTKSNEVSSTCVVIGRGTQRGAPVMVNTRTNGWTWGAVDGVERWGENTVAGVYTDTVDFTAAQMLYAGFQSSANSNECDLSVNDSGGAMFIQDGGSTGTWKLAGIHYAVGDAYVSTNGASGSGFYAAIVDFRGLYLDECGTGCWTLAAPTNNPTAVANPFAFLSTRVSARVSWINSILNAAPAAYFSAGPIRGAAPLAVVFTNTSTGAITNQFWNFGDGNTTNLAPGYCVTNTYVNPGTYNVTLVVSGGNGASTNTSANLISVYDPFAWWQLDYFGSTNNADAAPTLDPYGTGMSNTNRFLTGFNPTNTTAYLHIISIAASNADVVIAYLGASGDNTYSPGVLSRTNVLEYTTGTANGSYVSSAFTSTGQTNILSGGGGLGTVTNMTDYGGVTNGPSRYYRVRVLLP
ncbi:MAG TPA: PKD domain-containing protein [Verrucomicrobiae bacterium]|nr:PKD domain-containing protein [Verrucomicrobiae bacterium]